MWTRRRCDCNIIVYSPVLLSLQPAVKNGVTFPSAGAKFSTDVLSNSSPGNGSAVVSMHASISGRISRTDREISYLLKSPTQHSHCSSVDMKSFFLPSVHPYCMFNKLHNYIARVKNHLLPICRALKWYRYVTYYNYVLDRTKSVRFAKVVVREIFIKLRHIVKC